MIYILVGSAAPLVVVAYFASLSTFVLAKEDLLRDFAVKCGKSAKVGNVLIGVDQVNGLELESFTFIAVPTDSAQSLEKLSAMIKGLGNN